MDRCLAIADLARILSEAADHPGRRHLADCPRCRTLVRRFTDFLDPAPLPDAAAAPAAAQELQRRLAAALPAVEPTPAAAGGRLQSTRDSALPRRSARRHPSRQWFALAAVVVLALGLFSIRQQLLEPELPRGRQAPVLRGLERDLQPPRVAETAAGLRVLWSPYPQSDGAVIVVLAADLSELVRLAVDDRGEHLFARRDDEGALPDAARFLSVEFVQEGDIVGRTPLLPLPRTDL
jgi:hypothetical protein